MYEKRFRLNHRPFAATADTSQYYPTTGHEHAFHQMVQALEGGDGCAVLVGDPGVGKTLIAHRILEYFQNSMTPAWIYNTNFADIAAFYQALLYDLDQPYVGKSEQELRLQFTDLLLKKFQENKPLLLVIDEAHLLKPCLLEEIRLLGNLETREGKAVHIVLIGGTEILTMLQAPEFQRLSQRIRTRLHLLGLDVHEAADYLVNHIRAAGGNPERLITSEAVEMLARATRGIPRLLNQAGHLAFQHAFMAEQSLVDAEAATEALLQLGLADANSPEEGQNMIVETPSPKLAEEEPRIIKSRSRRRKSAPPPSPKRAVPIQIIAKQSA